MKEGFDKFFEKCCKCCVKGEKAEGEEEEEPDMYDESVTQFLECYDAANPVTSREGQIRFLNMKIKYLEANGQNKEAEIFKA